MAAEAAASASLRELAAALKASGTAPKLQTLQLLGSLGLDDEQDALEAELMNEVVSAVEKADGPAGDRVKYEYAVGSMVRRWQLFLALHKLGEQEPTHEMVKLFVGFLYTFRQRSIKTGRQGLGDSMAEMAQYILAQVRACGGGRRGRRRRERDRPMEKKPVAVSCVVVRCARRRSSRGWATLDGWG
jgi:hypothetical protein